MNRTQVFDALYQRLTGIEGLVEHSKRLVSFANIGPAQQPYMAFEVGDQTSTVEAGRFPRWSLRFNIYVLVHDTAADGPMPTLLALVDRIETALKAQPGETSGPHTTLGGKVVAARIAGTINYDLDESGAQGGCVIPVEVVVAN